MGIFISADSNQPLYEVKPDGTDFKLAQLYTLLSCSMIEILPLADGLIMVLDEEGKLVEKPRNERATRIANFVTPKQLMTELLHTRETGIEVIRVGEPITDLSTETDYIAGDVLICADDEVR
jgi:hypothetical protein